MTAAGREPTGSGAAGRHLSLEPQTGAMAAQRGDLSRLAIVAVVVVVSARVQVGLAYSRGEILQSESITGAEERLHGDVRTAANAESRRAEPSSSG